MKHGLISRNIYIECFYCFNFVIPRGSPNKYEHVSPRTYAEWYNLTVVRLGIAIQYWSLILKCTWLIDFAILKIKINSIMFHNLIFNQRFSYPYSEVDACIFPPRRNSQLKCEIDSFDSSIQILAGLIFFTYSNNSVVWDEKHYDKMHNIQKYIILYIIGEITTNA